MISDGAMALRLVLAAVLGGLVGVERELRDQAAGLRTHMIVAVGSCLFTLVSAYGFAELAASPSSSAVRADVTRIASQVVVGIGFLGGGTILRHGTTVRGLTTAASLWVTAAIGLAIGAGMYVVGSTGAALAVFSLAILKPFEERVFPKFRRDGEPPGDVPPD